MTTHPTSKPPGSDGEHRLQERLGTMRRAAAFYNHQMLDHLNPLMRDYLAQQEMAFIATSDANGNADCSFRAGPPGFMRVIDDRTLLYPELRGNGVMATLGNLTENPHIGILFIDFYESAVGLHVNGRAHLVEEDTLSAFRPLLERLCGGPLVDEPTSLKARPERWVMIEVEEAYIHCSKNIPLVARLDKDHVAGAGRGSGDFFRAKHSSRPWAPRDVAAHDAPAPGRHRAVPDSSSAATQHDSVADLTTPSPSPSADQAAPSQSPQSQTVASLVADLTKLTATGTPDWPHIADVANTLSTLASVRDQAEYPDGHSMSA